MLYTLAFTFQQEPNVFLILHLKHEFHPCLLSTVITRVLQSIFLNIARSNGIQKIISSFDNFDSLGYITKAKTKRGHTSEGLSCILAAKT